MGTLYGGVVYHRWFANGAGWAYHPAASGGSPAEQPGLTKALDERRLGALACAVPGGVLWGEQVLDPECPDPKATTRTPTILRAVFLPAGPRTPEQGAAILAALRAVSPAEAGADTHLTIPQSLVPSAPSRVARRAGLAVLGALLVVGSGVAVWQLSAGNAPGGPVEKRDPDPNPKLPVPPNGNGTPTGPGKELRPSVPESPGEKFAAILGAKKVPGVDKAGGPDGVIRWYFGRFAVPDGLPAQPDKDQPHEHPDVAFARRLGGLTRQPRSDPWNEGALRDELGRLYGQLLEQKLIKKERTARADLWEDVTELVGAIEDAVDYVNWLNDEGARNLKGTAISPGEFVFALDRPAPEARQFAYRFVRPGDGSAAWKAQVAQAMEYLPLLEKWGVKGLTPTCQFPWCSAAMTVELLARLGALGLVSDDAQTRPALVFHAVIGFVTENPFFHEKKAPKAMTYAAALWVLFAGLRENWDNIEKTPDKRAAQVITNVFGSIDNATLGGAVKRYEPLVDYKPLVDEGRGEKAFYRRFRLR